MKWFILRYFLEPSLFTCFGHSSKKVIVVLSQFGHSNESNQNWSFRNFVYFFYVFKRINVRVLQDGEVSILKYDSDKTNGRGGLQRPAFVERTLSILEMEVK